MIDLKRKRKSTELDLTPVMDVIFILLIFFIIASAFTVRGLDLDLPAAQSSQAVSGRIVELRLLKNGAYVCDGIPVEKDFLRYKLQDIVRGFRKNPGQLVLKADPDAPVDALIHIVDEVRLLGGEKLMIATTNPADNK